MTDVQYGPIAQWREEAETNRRAWLKSQDQLASLTAALELIASRAAGCQLQPHDPSSNEPAPELEAVTDIYEWARAALGDGAP